MLVQIIKRVGGCKKGNIICVCRVCMLTSRRVEWHVKEGEAFEPVKHVATVRGPVRKILLGERVALNTLARCSGIATK